MVEAEFQQLLALYIEAMPASERKPEGMLRRMLADPAYQFELSKRADEVVGFSIVRQFSRTAGCLLEYLAVANRYRGQGIGHALFRKLRGFILIEVDADKAQTRAFYRKLGCREVVGLDYLMPAVAAEVPPRMNLWMFSKPMPSELRLDQIQEWLESIYWEVYAEPLDDPRIAMMLQTLADPVPLL